MEIKINKETFERICKKQNHCSECPLLITKIVEDDDTYDYHARKICAKDYSEQVLDCLAALLEEQGVKSVEESN